MNDDGFGERFATLWRMRGFPSKAEFCRYAGLEPITVRRWERGETRPRAAQLEVLADALGVSSDVILGRAPMPDSLPRVAIDEASDAIDELRATLAETSRPLTAAEALWLQAAPNFRSMTVGSLLDAIRAQRSGMTEAQAKASTEATDAARRRAEEWGVKPRKKR